MSRNRNESLFNPSTWCNPELERSNLIDYSSSSNLDLNEVLYALNAFWATLKPVALSLLLSSLAVIYIQSEATRQDKQSGLKVYEIDDDDTMTDDETRDSNSTKLGKSLINAIVIICVIAFFTFILVFCYWMRCMKFLLGYMIFSSGLLLSLLGGIIWYTALIKWDLPCDAYTFFIVLYNFALVGIIAIFYQKGIPTIVTQAYLVCTSVILAWQLSRFDEWTCWSLLLMLALYDLCAVLTPCGPLKMLVGLMQERNEPLPGLLYEASLPPPTDFSANQEQRQYQERTAIPSPMSLGVGMGFGSWAIMMGTSGYTPPREEDESKHSLADSQASSDAGNDIETSGHGLLPAAVSNTSDNISLTEPPIVRRKQNLSSTPAIGSAPPTSPPHYDGRPEIPSRSNSDEDDKEHSIKLGLGDFVFYSVLVSRAATYGFAAFVSCSLVILGGLGMTLVLLSVFRKALPALPISIFLGIFFYLCTRFLVVPFLESAAGGPIYM